VGEWGVVLAHAGKSPRTATYGGDRVPWLLAYCVLGVYAATFLYAVGSLDYLPNRATSAWLQFG